VTEIGMVPGVWLIFLEGQPHYPPQMGVTPVDPNFCGSPLLMHTWFDAERPNLAW